MEFEQVAGMESINHEFDNVYNLTAGLESIMVTGPADSYDGCEARYAHTVLTLNDIDVSGQEGFLDGIKKGAAKVYEWIKDLIKTIRGWFTGSSKAQYEKDKKEINDAINQANVKRAKELKEKGMDEFVKQMVDVMGAPAAAADPVVSSIKRMNPDEKKAANEALKDVDIPNVSSPKELDESIRGTVVNEIASKVATKINQLNTKVKEIQRIDPNGQTREFMGVDSNWTFILDGVRNNEDSFNKEDQSRFVKRIQALINAADGAQADLAKITVNMDRLNEKYKGHEHTAEGKILSRAVAIFKLMTEIAALYRSAIESVSKELREGYKKAATHIVKMAIVEAAGHVSNAMDKYIEQDMKDLGF